MKKHDPTHQNGKPRHQSNSRSKGQTNRRRTTSQNGNGSGNRFQNKKNDAKAAQMWVNSNSKTLTSHLPTGSNGSVNSRARHAGHNQENGRPASRHNKNFHSKNPRRHTKPRAESHTKNGLPRNSPLQSSPDFRSNGSSSSIDPFELFCAYHLGIGPNNTYKPANINQVAQRFGVDPATIRQTTKEFGFDSESMLDKDFDLALAQLDIQVAPEGISKLELAKGIYEEFKNAPTLKRDWNKILEEDMKENVKVFGS